MPISKCTYIHAWPKSVYALACSDSPVLQHFVEALDFSSKLLCIVEVTHLS